MIDKNIIKSMNKKKIFLKTLYKVSYIQCLRKEQRGQVNK